MHPLRSPPGMSENRFFPLLPRVCRIAVELWLFWHSICIMLRVSAGNIMLVEAKKDSLLSMNLLLKFNGYKVATSGSLEEAAKRICSVEDRSKHRDLIITDLPLSRLRSMMDEKNQWTERLLVIVLTDFFEEKASRESIADSIYIIEKPVDSRELLKLVNRTLTHSMRRKT